MSAQWLRSPLPRFYASAFCMDGAFFLILAATPFKVLDLSGGPVALGSVPAIGSVIYIAFTLLSGRWSDRLGRTGLCLAGNAMLILFTLLVYRCGSVAQLLALVPLMGIGKALYWPVVEASVADLSGPARLTHNIGRFNVAWSAGKASGFLLSGLLLARYGFRPTFLAGTVLVILAFLFLPKGRLALPVTVDLAQPGVGGRALQVPAAKRRAFRNMGWLANLAANGVAAVLVSQLPAWFVDRSWSENRFGLFLALVFLTQTFCFLLLAGRVRFIYSARRLLGPQVVAGVPLVILPWLPTWGWYGAFALLLGVSFGVSYASSIYYSLHTERGKGMNAGIHEALVGAGGFLPPLLAGLLARGVGWLGAPYLLAAGWLLLALLGQYGIWRRWRRELATGLAIVGILGILLSVPASVLAQRFWPPWLRDDQPEPAYPDLTVSAAWLAEHRHDPALAIVDARSRAIYQAGHIPGAVSLPVDSLLAARSAADYLGRTGLPAEFLIVCYGDQRTFVDAALLFWRLELAGGRRVRLLDGGAAAWQSTGGELVKTPVTRDAVTWTAEIDSTRLATASYIMERFGREHCEILDARASGLGGTDLAMHAEGSAWREGHIPHALPFDFLTLIQSDGTLLSPPEMRSRLGEVGPRPTNPVDLEAEFIVYDDGISGGGARGYLCLRMAGIPGVRYFPGGWQDWVEEPARPMVHILTARELADRLRETAGSARGTAPEDTILPFILLDVRHRLDYEQDHVPGAVLLPAYQFRDSLQTVIDRHWPQVDRKRTPAAVYCYGPHCIRSRNCATILAQAGFSRPEWFRGGMQHWRHQQRQAGSESQ